MTVPLCHVIPQNPQPDSSNAVNSNNLLLLCNMINQYLSYKNSTHHTHFMPHKLSFVMLSVTLFSLFVVIFQTEHIDLQLLHITMYVQHRLDLLPLSMTE